MATIQLPWEGFEGEIAMPADEPLRRAGRLPGVASSERRCRHDEDIGNWVAVGLGIALLPQGSPRAEAAEKAKVKEAQKGTNDKGIAWVSGDGGVRGYPKAGKGLKARTTKNASFPPSRLQSMLVNSANVQKAKRPKGLKSK